jgi:putative transcriptional regulator
MAAVSIVPPELDVKAIRKKSHLTQRAFAEMFGISLKTLQHWEAGRRVPTGPARAFLKVIAHEPDVVRRVMRAA